jgi:hypothetical protein
MLHVSQSAHTESAEGKQWVIVIACMARIIQMTSMCNIVPDTANSVQNMASSPSAGNSWAQMNQNTWPSAGGSTDQAALKAQAQALALQLSLSGSLSGNLDQVLFIVFHRLMLSHAGAYCRIPARKGCKSRHLYHMCTAGLYEIS